MKRRSPVCPVQVSVLYKAGGREEFDCFSYAVDPLFIRLLSLAPDGRIRTTYLAKDQVRVVSIDEFPPPPQQLLQPLQPQWASPPDGQTPTRQPPMESSQAYSPKDDPRVQAQLAAAAVGAPMLRSGKLPDGTPVSQVAGGGLVPAGFIS